MKKHEITEMTIAMRTGNLKMENDGDYWSDEDRQKLKEMFYAVFPTTRSPWSWGGRNLLSSSRSNRCSSMSSPPELPESAVQPPSPPSAYVPSAPLTGANVPAASITSKSRR